MRLEVTYPVFQAFSAQTSLTAKVAFYRHMVMGGTKPHKIRFPDQTARAPVSPEMARGEPVHTGSLPAIVGVKQSAVK